MLPLGHSSAGFLISQLKKPKPNLKEIIFLIVSANIFDLDLLFLYIFQRPLFIHHRLPTHTPLFGLLYLLIFYILLKKKFRPKIFLLSALAMISHLILDNISYSIYPSIVNHPIAWGYPFFDPGNTINNNLINLSSQDYKTEISTVTDYYFTKTPIVLYAEFFLFFLSLYIGYKNYSKRNKNV